MKGLNIASMIQPYARKASKGKVLPDILRRRKLKVIWSPLVVGTPGFAVDIIPRVVSHVPRFAAL